MAKKKGRTVNKIGELNLEIDYEKLANALLKAQSQQTAQHSGTRNWMKFFLCPTYFVLSVVSVCFSVRCYINGMKTIAEAIIVPSDLDATIPGVLTILVGLIASSFSASSCIAVVEIWKEKDRQYVASMFGNIIALVALIVALIHS